MRSASSTARNLKRVQYGGSYVCLSKTIVQYLFHLSLVSNNLIDIKMWSYAGVQIAVHSYANASGQYEWSEKTNAQKIEDYGNASSRIRS